MALKVAIQKSKEVALWREYKDDDGNVLAEFKIRGDGYKPYRVALERANNQIASKGFEVSEAGIGDKLFHELLIEAAACHLIADWKGIEFDENGKITAQTCTAETATKLLSMGDIGVAVWVFVKTQAQSIQQEADAYEADILGKSITCTDTIAQNGTPKKRVKSTKEQE